MNRNNSKSFFRIIQIFLFLLILTGLSCSLQEENPKNIILFIGDGMGTAHVTAAKTVNGSLNMERLPVGGFLTTHSINKYITDSAASGTALATGYKTYNGAIAISQALDTLKTVLEQAEECGKSTGLVSTSSITHATPASFGAHVNDRDKHAQIALDLVHSGVDVMIGGGLGYFLPNTHANSLRDDELDLISQLELDYPVVTAHETFQQVEESRGLYGFLAIKHMPEDPDQRVPLAELTHKAIEILSRNRKGFFLMVEGSQIDWAAHDNDSDRIIRETIDFDNAVGIGLDYAEKEGNTLVIVTADHETGGYAVENGSIEKRKISEADFTTGSHTGSMVPLFGYGPGSSRFGGIHDNTFVGKMLIEMVRR
ncbi:alkaline phosphatase [bacterium]